MTEATSTDLERLIAQRDAWRELALARAALAGLTRAFWKTATDDQRTPIARTLEAASALERGVERVHGGLERLRELGIEPWDVAAGNESGEGPCGDLLALAVADAAADGFEQAEPLGAVEVSATAFGRVIALCDASSEHCSALSQMLAAFARCWKSGWRNDLAALDRAIDRVDAANNRRRRFWREARKTVAAEGSDGGPGGEREQLADGDGAAAEGLDQGEQLAVADAEGRAASASSSLTSTSRSCSTPFADRDRGELPGALERR